MERPSGFGYLKVMKKFVGSIKLTMDLINLGSSDVGIRTENIIKVKMNSDEIFDSESFWCGVSVFIK